MTSETYYQESFYGHKEGVWANGDPIFLLATALFVRYCMYSLVAPTPTPSGSITTVISFGAMFGRFYGEIMNQYFGWYANSKVLAVCGAAGYAAVMTRTTSPAIIMMELVGDYSLSIPLFITVFFGYSVASMYTMGMFEALMQVSQTPYLPMLYSSVWTTRAASEVMTPIDEYLTVDSTLLDVICIFADEKVYDMEGYFPVFEDEENYFLAGSIKIQNLVDYLHEEIERIKNRLKLGRKNTKKIYAQFFEELEIYADTV